ncbi:MAG: HD domain-containing protein [Desulfobacteraceae bacterium]
MKCPGQDTKYWNEDAIFEIKCPECGHLIEFFKDDTTRLCKNCNKKTVNPKMDFGCAAYCRYAEQCLGTLPEEFVEKRKDLLKDRVAIEMKRYFGHDFKRIGHASKVAWYAEKIGKAEQGDLPVILCAAYLHDIGIKNAEEKYGSATPEQQEEEGPPVARQILEKMGADEEIIHEVCDIVGHHHHPEKDETLNFKCLYDADLIVNYQENGSFEKLTDEKIHAVINRSFLTEYGKKTAFDIFLSTGDK